MRWKKKKLLIEAAVLNWIKAAWRCISPPQCMTTRRVNWLGWLCFEEIACSKKQKLQLKFPSWKGVGNWVPLSLWKTLHLLFCLSYNTTFYQRHLTFKHLTCQLRRCVLVQVQGILLWLWLLWLLFWYLKKVNNHFGEVLV